MRRQCHRILIHRTHRSHLRRLPIVLRQHGVDARLRDDVLLDRVLEKWWRRQVDGQKQKRRDRGLDVCRRARLLVENVGRATAEMHTSVKVKDRFRVLPRVRPHEHLLRLEPQLALEGGEDDAYRRVKSAVELIQRGRD